MKALVTGGGGFLGGHIVKELLARGFQVESLARNVYSHLEDLGVKNIKLDLTDKKAVLDLDLSTYDVIFHVAAKAGVWGKYLDYYRINYTATKNLIEKAKVDGVKAFIYTSTPSVVASEEDILGIDESAIRPNKFLSAYAETKALAEDFVLKEASDRIRTLALRPHLIWGPGDPHILPRLKEKARLGKLKRVGAGENLVDVIYVENAAKAHVDAYEALMKNEKLNGEAYFIGQEKPVNLWDFINQLLIISKLEPVSSSISFGAAYKLGFLLEKIYGFLGIKNPEPPMTRFVATQLGKNHYFNQDKARKDFDYHPSISIEEGLKRLTI